MRVGVIVTEVGRGIGGRYTFQEMLLAAVERARPSTRHEFVIHRAGWNRYAEGPLAWKARRLATVGATLALRAVHDVQDALVGTRLVHVATPLERRLEADAIDLVWFPTYVEDVSLPYVCQVFDLEHRMKPWFPEVSRHGEWEHRERHYRRYLPKATRVIVAGETGREQVSRFFGVPPENCLPLKHPTPDFALAAAQRKPQPVESVTALGIRQPYLLYPGQFWAHKNHAAALDALAELRGRGEDLSLVLVGSDKGQRGLVEAQVRERGLDDAVLILGYVEEEQLVSLYQHAHALLYLSRFGPENLPPLEAFALGCPVVVADVPGAAEQVGEAGIVVDPDDTAAVADAVQRLNAAKERARLVKAGQARAGEWTADDYLAGLIAFLDEFERERRLWR
ncbi:MAG: glycosyltransferase family 4 protein [Thermoleophilia bacterium]|nr:glycosyltransferase family 4 protein [Thermoleophilia bacterium]